MTNAVLSNDLVTDLKMVASWKDTLPSMFNMEGWLLKNGQTFGPSIKRPKGVRLMTKKQCYSNSTLTVLRKELDPEVWFYCEGKVLVNGLPILIDHAWLANKHTGEVIDRTLRHKPGTAVYYGIPFSRDYLINTTMKRGYYGLFSDNYMMNGELLEADVGTYRAWPKEG